MKKRFKEAMPPRHKLWQQRRKQHYTELLVINSTAGWKKFAEYPTSDSTAAQRCCNLVKQLRKKKRNLQVWYRFF